MKLSVSTECGEKCTQLARSVLPSHCAEATTEKGRLGDLIASIVFVVYEGCEFPGILPMALSQFAGQ